MKNFRLILLVTALIFVNACTSTNTKDRSLASGDQEILRVSQLDVPVDIILNTEYRGTFVAEVPKIKSLPGMKPLFSRHCTGSISIWFYKDSDAKLRYYSKGQKADGVNCKLPKIGDLADKSQSGMDSCAGLDFNYKVVDLENIDYLRELDFDKMRINAPVCSETKSVDEYKDTLELKILKSNGGSGNLHLQITMFKLLKMNY